MLKLELSQKRADSPNFWYFYNKIIQIIPGYFHAKYCNFLLEKSTGNYGSINLDNIFFDFSSSTLHHRIHKVSKSCLKQSNGWSDSKYHGEVNNLLILCCNLNKISILCAIYFLTFNFILYIFSLHISLKNWLWTL